MGPRRSTSTRKLRRTDRFASVWHLGWALAVAAAAGIMLAAGRIGPGPELSALAGVIVAAALGALLSTAGSTGRTIVILGWALAGAVAVQLTGGLPGPLAPWCLAPVAAAAAMRKPSLLALGAAAGVAAAGIAILAGVFLPAPTPDAALLPWLSLLSVGTTTIAFSAAALGLMGRMRAEQRSRVDAELGLLELLDHQPQLLLTVDADGKILTAHGAPLAGAPARDLPGRAFAELAASQARPVLEAALQSAAEHGSAELFFTPYMDHEGSQEVTLRRLTGGRVAAAVRDARAQRAREQELEAARASAEQQNAGKSRFLANMSHELRTPLNAIMGFSDITRQRLFGPIADRYAEYAELIHESGSHLLELINDILDMSKIEADRYELALEQFDARDPVQAVLRLMRGQADRMGVNLRALLPTEPLPTEADRRALKQIALNLISNAIKFTPRGGSVTVTLQGAGDVLELVVADTGVGIAPEDLERLGKPFEQAGGAEHRAEGTGLGLSLVKAFAGLHGGEMSLESELGRGSSVTVRLPVLTAFAPEPKAAREA